MTHKKHQILMTRYYQYLLERFHPGQFTLLSILIATTLTLGESMVDASKSTIDIPLVASMALLLFLLRLRIFDEFKDHEHDTLHYPQRPLPRGLLSKTELRFMLALVFAGELTLLSFGGIWARVLFCIAFGYSLLLYKEFFLYTWLRKRFTLYVISHELLVIPLFVYIASFAASGYSPLFTVASAALIGFTGMQLFLLEVARKMRAKEHEIASHDTYTAQYGVRGAGTLLFFCALFSIIGLVLFERCITGSAGWLSLFGCVSLLVFVLPIRTFMHMPTAAHASRLFGAAIFFFAITHIAFIICALFSLI